MSRVYRRLVCLTAGALALAVCTAPVGVAVKAHAATVNLAGSQVVPGPGDPDGAGGFFYTLWRQTGAFCFDVDSTGITTPLTAVHLHRGPVRGDGELVAELHGPSADIDVSGCLDFGRTLATEIAKSPDSYYVDVHNEEFPGGALRAQLR